MRQNISIFWRNKQLRMAMLVLFLVPLLFNAIALWHDIGGHTLLQAITGNYIDVTGFAYNPLPQILPELTLVSFVLTSLSSIIIIFANLNVLRRLPIVLRLLLRLCLILFSGVVFANVSGVFMPLSWLPKFNDYLLGMPVSEFATIGSWVIVFPTITIAFFLAVQFFEKGLEPSIKKGSPPSMKVG
jgi:hypothetical protein